MKLPHQVLHYSLFSIRAGEVALPKLSNRKLTDLVIDSSGRKVFGEGDWKFKVDGTSQRRNCIKAHIAIDSTSQEVMAVEVTEGGIHDAKALPVLVEHSPRSVKRVLVDGAYHGSFCRNVLYGNGIEALLPPQINSLLADVPEFEAKNDALRIIKGLGAIELPNLSGSDLLDIIEEVLSKRRSLA